jgi:hypothetical protein
MSRDRVAAAARADRRLRKKPSRNRQTEADLPAANERAGHGVLSVLAYVSTIEDRVRFDRSRPVGAHLACFFLASEN